MTTTTVLAKGTTYALTYRPTLYGKPVTKVLTVTEVLTSGLTGKVTYVLHGARGGKTVVGAAEIITAEAAR